MIKITCFKHGISIPHNTDYEQPSQRDNGINAIGMSLVLSVLSFCENRERYDSCKCCASSCVLRNQSYSLTYC